MTYHVHAFSDILGLEDALDDLNGKIDDHIADLDNPHQTTIPKLDDTSIINPTPGQGLFLADDGVTWVNRASFTESWPTGLANGGELNIGPGPNDIEVLSGAGVVIDSYTDPDSPPVSIALTWDQINAAITAVPSVAGNIAWFSIANSGIGGLPIGNIPTFVGELRQYATAPSPTLAREEIFLGVAIYNGITWNEVSSPKVINQAAETLREIATVVLPKSIIIAGGEVTEQAGFTLNQAEGTIWENNRNWHVSKSDPNREQLPPSTPIVFEPLNRDFSDVLAPTSVIDPDLWDDGGVISAVPGPANTCTIQRLYIDLANNYWLLLGQTLYANWNEAQANRQAYNPVVPFLLQNSLYLGAAIVEKGKTDWDVDEATFLPPSESGGGPAAGTPITTFTGLVDTPTSYTGQFPLVPVVDPTELFLQFDYRTKAVGDYVEGVTYNIGDEVSDGANQSEALINGVTSPPFVSPIGENRFIYQGTMVDGAPVVAKLINFGIRIPAGLEPAYIKGYRIWTVAGNQYTVFAVRDPNGAPAVSTLLSFTATDDEWQNLSLPSPSIYTGEVDFDVIAQVQEPDPTPATFEYTYDYQTPQNFVSPANGQMIQGRSQPDVIAVSYFDNGGNDRTTVISGLELGDQITAGNLTWSIQAATQQIGYAEFAVAPATVGIAGVQTITFETKVATPITVGEDPLYWDNEPAPRNLIRGLIGVDTSLLDTTPNGNAYGIDVEVQDAFIPDSAEWRLKIIGGISSASGDGGFTPAVFMGAGTTGYVPDPLTENDWFLRDDGTWVLPSSGGQVNTVVGGTDITVDATDPVNPIVNYTGSSAAGFWDANGDDIYNNNTGFVGIGTDAPSQPLHVVRDAAGIVMFAQSDPNGANQRFFVRAEDATGSGVVSWEDSVVLDGNSSGGLAIGESSGTAPIKFYAGASRTERMRITAAGDVGIGTDNPTAPLQVERTQDAQIRINNSDPLGSNRAGVRFSLEGATQGYVFSEADKALSFASGGNTARMWLNSVGFLSVNTADISADNGSTYAPLTIKNTPANALGAPYARSDFAAAAKFISNEAATGWARIDVEHYLFPNFGIYLYQDQTGEGALRNINASPLGLGTGNATGMKINTSNLVTGVISNNGVVDLDTNMQFVTQAQYDAGAKDADTFYFIVG